MRISKEVRDETLRKIEEIANKETHWAGEFSVDLILKIFRPVNEESPEIGEFISKTLGEYCEIPAEEPDARKIFFAVCMFALADMFKRQEEINRLEE